MVHNSTKTNKTVLVIDDDPNFTKLLKNALGSESVEAVVAPKAADASIEIDARNFDLIIVDGELPDKNGMQWLQEAHDKLKQTPIMFVSASWRDSESHEKLVGNFGVKRIVHKPVSLEVLVDETMRLLHANTQAPDSSIAVLHELTIGYMAEISAEFQKLRDAVRYMAPAWMDAEELKTMINAAHKIHGTGGLYGFDEISRIAGSIESDLTHAQKHGKLDDLTRTKILNALHRAAEEIDKFSAVSGKQQKEYEAEKRRHEQVKAAGAQRVVIVDDDTFFLKRVEHLLSAEGILLNSYSDSEKVVSNINTFNPDLVVLDVNMPGLNGLEVCRELRERAAYPIFVISADSTMQDAALQAGATTFLSKPFKNMQFVQMIKDALAGA